MKFFFCWQDTTLQSTRLKLFHENLICQQFEGLVSNFLSGTINSDALLTFQNFFFLFEEESFFRMLMSDMIKTNSNSNFHFRSSLDI